MALIVNVMETNRQPKVMSPNPPVERDRRQAGLAGSLRGFTAPAAGYLKRWAP